MRKFKVKGKTYILKELKHKNGEDTFKLIPLNKAYDKRIDRIAEKLSKVVNKKEVVKQALYKLELKEID